MAFKDFKLFLEGDTAVLGEELSKSIERSFIDYVAALRLVHSDYIGVKLDLQDIASKNFDVRSRGYEGEYMRWLVETNLWQIGAQVVKMSYIIAYDKTGKKYFLRDVKFDIVGAVKNE